MTTEMNDTPPGWKLVPVEPTEAMIDRFVSRALCVSVSGDGGWSGYGRSQWSAMLAASPEPPARHLPSREEIAEVISPHAFRAYNRLIEYSLREGDSQIEAAGYADRTYGRDIAYALSKADAILSLLRGDTENGGEG